MSWQIAIRPAAQEDINKAADWYESRSPGLGTAFVREIRTAITTLSAHPQRFPIRNRRSRARWFYPHRFPYRIVYLVRADTVTIVAVLHAARHDNEYRKRLASD